MLTSEQRKKPKQSKIRYTEYYSLQETFDKLYADSKNGKVFNHLIELISSDENINDIAESVGFRNFTQFYREFKKFYHVTPREYRLAYASYRQKDS